MHFIVIDDSNDDFDINTLWLELTFRGPGHVDTLGSVLAWDRAIHGKNYISAKNVQEMVEKILNKLGSQSIERLTIWGHGIPGAQGVGAGDSRFSPGLSLGLLMCVVNGRLAESQYLRRLCGRFSWDGRVDMHGCNVAQHHSGRLLLRTLCDLWRVPVRAAINSQWSQVDDRFNGPVIEAFPRQGHGSRVHLMNSGG